MPLIVPLQVSVAVGGVKLFIWQPEKFNVGKLAVFATGAVVSSMITFWVLVVTLPLPSLKAQVTTYVPSVLYVIASFVVPVTVPAQLSEAVGGVNVMEHCAVTLDKVTVGAILSVTVTVNEQVVKLPAASSTLYVAVVTPKLKTLVPKLFTPVVAELAIVAPVNVQVNFVTEQLSAVVGFGVTTLAVQDALVLAVMFVGQVIVGLILSVTVTVKEQVAVLFAASVIV